MTKNKNYFIARICYKLLLFVLGYAFIVIVVVGGGSILTIPGGAYILLLILCSKTTEVFNGPFVMLYVKCGSAICKGSAIIGIL